MNAVQNMTREEQPLPQKPIRVLCVDDNQQVAEAVRIKFERAGAFIWNGWLASADNLLEIARRDCPDVILLDADMPGRNPFEVLEELSSVCVQTRTVIFSGHVRFDLIEQAFAAGAWGYVSKSDGEDELVRAVRAVCAGEIAMSGEVRAAYGSH